MVGSGWRTTRFEVVKVAAMKNGICPVCGKKANRSKTFEGTINPFNRTEDRSRPKTREEVAHDLREMAAEWRGMPTYHARCEP